jgi:hypothetical protein
MANEARNDESALYDENQRNNSNSLASEPGLYYPQNEEIKECFKIQNKERFWDFSYDMTYDTQ